jgi:hypothetical protein
MAEQIARLDKVAISADFVVPSLRSLRDWGARPSCKGDLRELSRTYANSVADSLDQTAWHGRGDDARVDHSVASCCVVIQFSGRE